MWMDPQLIINGVHWYNPLDKSDSLGVDAVHISCIFFTCLSDCLK